MAGGYYPAFLDLVRRTLRRDYREEDLTEAGLRIFSTLNPFVQSRAEQALTQELDRLDKARKQKEQAQTRRRRRRHGAAERRSRRPDRRTAGELRRFQSRARCEALDRFAGEAGHLSRRHRERRYNAASIVEDAPVEVKLSNGQSLGAAEYLGGVLRTRAARARARAIHESGDGASRTGRWAAEGDSRVRRARAGERAAATAVRIARCGRCRAARSRAALQRICERRLQHAAARRTLDPRRRRQTAQVVCPGSDARRRSGRGVSGEPNAGAGHGARHGARRPSAYLPPSVVVAGKSGTSSDYRDSWFAGFSASLSPSSGSVTTTTRPRGSPDRQVRSRCGRD